MRIIDVQCRHGWILLSFKRDMNSLLSFSAFDVERSLRSEFCLIRPVIHSLYTSLTTLIFTHITILHVLTRTLCPQVREVCLASLQTPASWMVRCTTQRWRRAPRDLGSPSSEVTAQMSFCKWKTCSVMALLPTTTRWHLVSKNPADVVLLEIAFLIK